MLLLIRLDWVSGHGSRQITYIVPKQQKACFANTWSGDEKIFFEYHVIKGGARDLDVQIITPNGMVLYDKQRSGSDEVTFTPSNGEFRFCFDNSFSKITDKVVSFNVRSAFTRGLAAEAGDRIPTVLGSGEVSCDVIHEATSAVLEFQRKYRIRESIGRHLAEKLKTVVTWWSLSQSLVVVLCGLGQVLILKKFFTEKRLSTKPAEGEPEEKQVISYT